MFNTQDGREASSVRGLKTPYGLIGVEKRRLAECRIAPLPPPPCTQTEAAGHPRVEVGRVGADGMSPP